MASPSASRACSDEFATLHGLLARFGETGWVEGLTTLSGPQEGRENRAVTGGKLLHCLVEVPMLSTSPNLAKSHCTSKSVETIRGHTK
jgi:hypothetical protein